MVASGAWFVSPVLAGAVGLVVGGSIGLVAERQLEE
jgi:hypothetical protein